MRFPRFPQPASPAARLSAGVSIHDTHSPQARTASTTAMTANALLAPRTEMTREEFTQHIELMSLSCASSRVPSLSPWPDCGRMAVPAAEACGLCPSLEGQ